MGSFENSTLIDEPLCDSIAEKHSCVEFTEKLVSEHWACSHTGSGMMGSNVNDVGVLDGYLSTTSDDTNRCGRCDNVAETDIVKRDVLVGERGNVVGVGLEGLENDECVVNRVSLNESQSEVGVCNSPNSFLILSQDESNVCVRSADVTGILVGSRDELVSVCENSAVSIFEEIMDNEFGVCLNENQCDVDVCCIETDGLCLEKRVFQGEDEFVKSLEGCQRLLGGTPGSTSPRCHDQLGEEKDDKVANDPYLEGTVEVMKEKTEVSTEVELVPGNQTFLSEGCGTTLESMPVTDVSRNCLQQDEHKDDKIIGCLPGKEEKNAALAGVEKDTSNEILSPLTSGVTSTTVSERNCVQKDDQKDGKTLVFPSLEVVFEDMEEKTDTLGGIERNTFDQVLPSECCENPTEVVTLPGSLRNFVHQDDLKKDKGLDSPSSEAVLEFVEEKTNSSDQMLLPQGCAMPSELKPGACSPRDCVERNQQRGDLATTEVLNEKDYALARIDKDICEQVSSLQDCSIHSESTYVTSSMKEFSEEKRDFFDGIQTDSCHPGSHSEYNELCTDIGLSTGLSSSSTQKYDQNNTQNISDPVVEWKTDASAGIQANICSWTSDIGEVPSKLLVEDDLLSCGGYNDQNDHDSFNHQDEEAIERGTETESNNDVCVLALPARSCQSSLENLVLTDSVCNYIQPSEQRSVDGPSAESVNEVLEEKSDVTTDVKVDISTQVLTVEESLKDDSSRMAHNGVEVSLQSCLPSGVGENSSSNKLDATDLFQKDPLVAISSSSAVDGSGLIDHEEKDNVRVDCFSETKYPDIVSSSARRSSGRISRSIQKDQTKRVARNCRRRAKVQNSCGSIDIVFKVVRRKRSCFSKPARSSIWGLLINIARIFNESDVTEFNRVQNQGSQKARASRGSRKRNKIGAGDSSLVSNGKCHATTKCIRLKVKVGKEVCQRSLDVSVPEIVHNTVADDAVICDQRTSESTKLTHDAEDKSGEEETDGQFQYFKKKPDETEKHLDDSILDVDLANNEDGNLIANKSDGDVADCHLGIAADKGAEILGAEIENNYVDPGTSPDSEVIDLVPDAQIGAGSQDSLNKTVLTSSKTFAAPDYVTSSKRGKKKDNQLEGNSILEGISHVAARLNKVKPPKKRGGRQKMADGSSETLCALPGANASSNSLSCEEFYTEPLPSVEEIELGGGGVAPAFESKRCSLFKSSKSAGMRKGRFKASGSERSRRKNACTPGVNQRKSVNKRKVKEKGVSIMKGREKGVGDMVEDKTEGPPETGSHIANDGERIEPDNASASDIAKMGIVSSGVSEQCSPTESAWVRCDECYKWRRIQVALANSIDEHCRWVCKDNSDKTFADCSIPQEKTNADINAELGLSDCEEDDGLLNYNRSEKELYYGNKSAFRRIDSNVFLHRSRKTQTIDEIMVCHCKQPRDGRLGCGDECLNRMLNIECVQGTCPCGDLCSNQQFQKRKYAKMQWQLFGKKGYGLKLQENILKGQFIIEYVGEVLDMQAYEARQQEYAANGHKHFYFMTLNGSEVIDACAKGNLGRFINHSCDPNCRTEKWMVNGEICIGLFALRDIKEGEELTFDYNYVRVFGAAARKCHCGSPQCRGYIGGDPLNSEVIYQGDSDEEYPEPLMIEDGESGDDLDNNTGRIGSFYGDKAQYPLEDTDKLDDATRAVGQLETTTDVKDSRNQSASAISQVQSSLELENSRRKYPSARSDIFLQAEDVSSITIAAASQGVSMEGETKINTLSLMETSATTIISSKLLLGGDDFHRKAKYDKVEEKQGLPKSLPRIKTSRSSGSLKKGKPGSSPLNGNKVRTVASKSQVLSFKPKKSVEGSSGRFEAVQEKLNELLDADGGISKRKDAPKGYLKLLLLTAASGDSGNGEAIQSNRDLSMILDALLKTKSRMVLLDIINKNGLQMLHKMMKQYGRDFKKTPILRKLLKVLEYLAVREILTRDHITGGPPCAGMESFRESILSLTEHDDKQVHQIARNFRDKWIPKPLRKSSYMDRDDSRMDFHRGAVNCNRLSTSLSHWHDQGLRPSEAIDCVMQSLLTTSVDSTTNGAGVAPCKGGCQNNGSVTRKRKSRWDQPAKVKLESKSDIHKEQKFESMSLQQLESSSFPKRSQVQLDNTDKLSREDSSCPDSVHSHCSRDEAVSSEDGGHTIQEDVPPGFSSPLNPPLVSSDASSTTDHPRQNVSHLKCLCDVAIGHPQGKFISRLPVSYGIPLHILQQFGSAEAKTSDSWVIAPGMPFQPFPPLPPFPRERKDTPPACADSCKTANESAEEWQQDGHLPTCDPEEDSPSTTGANQSDADTQGMDTQQPFKRMRGSSNDLGRRYFRQQKRKGPPWLWRRNELRGSYCSQDVCNRVDKPNNNFYQRPSQQNHH